MKVKFDEHSDNWKLGDVIVSEASADAGIIIRDRNLKYWVIGVNNPVRANFSATSNDALNDEPYDSIAHLQHSFTHMGFHKVSATLKVYADIRITENFNRSTSNN